MATLDCTLSATATKVEAVLDVEREAKIAKKIPKRTCFLLQLLDNQALITSSWLLRSVTSHFPALLSTVLPEAAVNNTFISSCHG